MAVSNKLQFAITREDPGIEIALIEQFHLKSMLAVCSGGDTLLAVKAACPKIRITGFDFNPAQIEHFQKKLKKMSPLNQEPDGLCQTGNFESLFRQWRLFLNEFVISREDTEKLFHLEDKELLRGMLSSKYWSVNFDLHFHDQFLLAMFGESAIQHAPRGSYPRYFQKAFERGFSMSSWKNNPFLQHLFFGTFHDLPHRPPLNENEDYALYAGTLFDVPDISTYDLIQLSNIFDWSSLEETEQVCQYLREHAKEGAVILIRQINNDSPVMKYLGNKFISHESLADDLWAKDRSLFYSKLTIAEKVD